VRLTNDHDPDGERREDDRADHEGEPEEWEVGAGALREQIPCRVEEGGGQDEREGEGTQC
jgi:hypothetical protein